MPTESEIKLARYSEVAKEADDFGRVIGVRRLRPSEQTKIAGYTSELTGYDEQITAKGEKIQIPHRMPMILAAAVCLIDDSHIPFPRSRGELDAIYDRLDVEGIKAAGTAFIKLEGGRRPTDENDVVVGPLDETKNL